MIRHIVKGRIQLPDNAHQHHCDDPDCHGPACTGEHQHHCDDPDCHDPHYTGEHQHHCTDPDCHDPACTGAHQHHCDDPDCHDPHCDGHHHHHDGPEQASVFAEKRDFMPAAPTARAALESAAVDAFMAVGAACCIDGILPGHAKGLVEMAHGALSLSLTSADCVDTHPLAGWDAPGDIDAFSVTVNVHLIVPCVLDEETIFAPFAALCRK